MPVLPPMQPVGSASDRESRKRMATLRETREMLDQGIGEVVEGVNGTGVMGRSVREGLDVVGEFPRNYPAGMFGDKRSGQTRKQIGLDVMEGPAPCEVQLSDGALHRVPGSQMPPRLTQVGDVAWFGGHHWLVKGGEWSYLYDDPGGWLTGSFILEDATLSSGNKAGWIVLVVVGSIQDSEVVDSPFKITELPVFRFVEALSTDFDYTLTLGNASAVRATYGMLPLAYVAPPGVHSNGPLLLPGGMFGRSNPQAIRACKHFNTWGNEDWH